MFFIIVPNAFSYTSTDKSEIICMQMELIFYPWLTHLTFMCVHQHCEYVKSIVLLLVHHFFAEGADSVRLVTLILITGLISVDRWVEICKKYPFSGITIYGRVWRMGAGKDGLELELDCVLTLAVLPSCSTNLCVSRVLKIITNILIKLWKQHSIKACI